jgi:hypothetical protein
MKVIKTPLNKKSNITKKLKRIAARLKSEGHLNPFNEASRLINLQYGENWRSALDSEFYSLNPGLLTKTKMDYFPHQGGNEDWRDRDMWDN